MIIETNQLYSITSLENENIYFLIYEIWFIVDSSCKRKGVSENYLSSSEPSEYLFVACKIWSMIFSVDRENAIIYLFREENYIKTGLNKTGFWFWFSNRNI